MAQLAYAITQQSLPRYSHAKSPHRYTLPQLAACVLLTFYLDVSYRDMEEWLLATDAVGRALGLKRVPIIPRCTAPTAACAWPIWSG